jgi:hypothetical protein
MARSTRRNTSSFHARSLIRQARLRPEVDRDSWRDRGWDNRGSAAEEGWGAWGWGRRDAQPAPEQRRDASGWERRNTEPYAEQRWSTWDWGRRDGQSYYPPQSQQSLQPAPPHSRDRGSSAPNRANTDDRRNRARQTPDRLQNGPLDLTRASKQTRPVDVRSTP